MSFPKKVYIRSSWGRKNTYLDNREYCLIVDAFIAKHYLKTFEYLRVFGGARVVKNVWYINKDFIVCSEENKKQWEEFQKHNPWLD